MQLPCLRPYREKTDQRSVLQRGETEETLTPAAQHQLKLYGRTFREMFRIFDGRSGRPTFESCFAQIAAELRDVTDESELYSKIFAGFWALPNLKETDRSWRSEPENQNAGGTCY